MSFTDVMTAPTYSIDFTDRTVDPTKATFLIPPGELNTATSLKLPGAGFASYGEFVDEDLLHLLENFASPVAPNNPTIGQIWYDSSVKRLKFLEGITNVGSSIMYKWSSVSDNTSFTTTPPDDLTRLWYDMSDANPQNHTLKIYNTASTTWQSVVPTAVTVQSTAPASTKTLWFNTSNVDPTKHELYAFNPGLNGWFPAVSHDAGMLTGNIPDSVLANSNIGGNAATATLASAAVKLATGRTISLSNGATGSVVFDGSADVTLAVTGLNANVLSSGTVPIARLGAAGNRAPGYYLDGSNTWLAMPYIPDAFTKTEMNNLLAQKLNINGTAVSANNVQGYGVNDILNAAYARVGTMGKRDLYVSTAAPVPSTGVVGDVWFKF